jgi:hypothetical protein
MALGKCLCVHKTLSIVQLRQMQDRLIYVNTTQRDRIHI